MGFLGCLPFSDWLLALIVLHDAQLNRALLFEFLNIKDQKYDEICSQWSVFLCCD